MQRGISTVRPRTARGARSRRLRPKRPAVCARRFARAQESILKVEYIPALGPLTPEVRAACPQRHVPHRRSLSDAAAAAG